MSSGLNKTALLAHKRQVARLRSVLPALQMKQRSLMATRAAEARTLGLLATELEAQRATIGEALPMLAEGAIRIEDKLAVDRVEIAQQSVLGIALPQLEAVHFSAAPVPAFVLPHWVEAVLARAQSVVRADLAVRIAHRRLALLDHAIAKVTQRVNLLEQVLIPDALARIRSIEIRLSDLERANVVVARIAKARLNQGVAP
jgi:V/A-type H+-transporting ATPase subunit D